MNRHEIKIPFLNVAAYKETLHHIKHVKLQLRDFTTKFGADPFVRLLIVFVIPQSLQAVASSHSSLSHNDGFTVKTSGCLQTVKAASRWASAKKRSETKTVGVGVHPGRRRVELNTAYVQLTRADRE